MFKLLFKAQNHVPFLFHEGHNKDSAFICRFWLVECYCRCLHFHTNILNWKIKFLCTSFLSVFLVVGGDYHKEYLSILCFWKALQWFQINHKYCKRPTAAA